MPEVQLFTHIAFMVLVPALLFLRPKFIRDFFGEGKTPIVLGFLVILGYFLQFYLRS